MAKFNLADILSGLNPNINSDLLRAVQYFTRGEQDIIKRLGKPGAAEKRGKERLKGIKSEDQIKQEIANLFNETRNISEAAVRSGRVMGEGLAQAVAGAAASAGGLAGGDTRVAQMIADAGVAAQAPTREAGTALSALGEAALGSTSVQQAAAVAEALMRRSEEVKNVEDLIAEAVGQRESALLEAKAGKRGNFLQMIGALLGLKGSGGGYGGYGTSVGGTGGGSGDTGVTNIYGQRKFEGDVVLPSGHYFYDRPGSAADVAQSYGVTSGSVPTRRPSNNPKRGYGPWSIG